MKNALPDYSLVRGGLRLDEWLWQLLDESPSVRTRAGEALQAMDWGLPSVHTDWATFAEFPDTKSQGRRFATGLKTVVIAPKFDTAIFVERLGAFALALQSDWEGRVSETEARRERRDDKYERIADRLAQRSNSTDDEAVKNSASLRFARLSAMYICGGCNQLNSSTAIAETLAPSGVMAHRIFDLLDVELLTAPAVLEAFLSHKNLRHRALSAIARVGPPASQFASRLISELDDLPTSDKKSRWFDAPHALGAIARDDQFIVNEMILRLTHTEGVIRRSAAQTLQHAGLAVCDRHEEICELLLPFLKNEDDWAAGLPALASVGRNSPSARATILSLAGPREKKPSTYDGFPDLEYDLTMHERGEAISALQYFVEYPDECMPVLIEAMQSFDEYDPDECYSGPLGRISSVIAKFGAAGEPAVASLVDHLNDEPDESPVSILDALASIGPSAKAAIPALQEIRQKWGHAEDGDVAIDVIDKDLDRYGWVIQQIQGVPKTSSRSLPSQ